ncbi:MAG: NrpR regulatory domain-containing protein [Chloroflexota bacterium]|nr:NrpR regulatory domain-containing protein [Chloroflexota bacterium]
MSFEAKDTERKELLILRVLRDSQGPMGASLIAQHLRDYGVELGERAVRYHLKLLDERRLTRLAGRRDGRVLTELGLKEVSNGLVKDKVGFVTSKIEVLAFRTTFDRGKRCGAVPVNVSFFPEAQFKKALHAMKPAFESGLCVSRLVGLASAGEYLGEVCVPEGKIGMATVCSIIVNGSLLKAGVPMDSRFAGILQLQHREPVRFVDLIEYHGSSLDPSEMFIRAGMTSVGQAARMGSGEILANFREIPAMCHAVAEEVVAGLKEAGFGGLIHMGNTSEPVCETPVELNKLGMILLGGLNPIAAAKEAGFVAQNHAMSSIMEYRDLTPFEEL